MTDRTNRVTQIVGTSPDGIEPAIKRAQQRAGFRPCGTWTGSR